MPGGRVDMDVVSLVQVNKHFGGVVVADNIDLELKAGAVTGLLGPNGAGKTSLFNLISGIVAPDSGTIFFEGQPITDSSVYQRARLGISRTWQQNRLFQSMSVMDNLMLGSRAYRGESLSQTVFQPCGLTQQRGALTEHAFHLLERVGLPGQASALVSQLSYGRQKLVGLARALMNDGTCLLLDEPMAGIEEEVHRTVKTLVREEANKGKAICVIEHAISFVRDLCDSAVFMFNGQIIAKAGVDELLADKKLTEIYFG